MNYYVIVEGTVEKVVYAEWIPLINPSLKQITSLDESTDSNFIIYEGGGYPYIFELIQNGINDVVDLNLKIIYRLVVVIDSEKMTRQEKFDEIDNFIKSLTYGSIIDYRIIVQHFCFEAWALGNRKIVSSNPSNAELAQYLKHFHVRKNDPELLTSISTSHGNRAQFAEKYLRKLLQQKFRQTYTKRNPTAVVHPKYFLELKKRLNDTDHINSFKALFDTFVL